MINHKQKYSRNGKCIGEVIDKPNYTIIVNYWYRLMTIRKWQWQNFSSPLKDFKFQMSSKSKSAIEVIHWHKIMSDSNLVIKLVSPHAERGWDWTNMPIFEQYHIWLDPLFRSRNPHNLLLDNMSLRGSN